MEKLAKAPPDERERLQNREVLMWYRALRRDLDEKKFLGILPDEALETATAICMANGVIGELEFWEEMKVIYQSPQTTAAVDSELTLALARRYQLSKWLPNPFNAGFDKFPAIAEIRQKTLMVGRLDGPTPEIARRLVDDALTVEAQGLQGVFYIDTRGLQGDDKYGGYAWYDHHLLQLYDLVKQRSTLKVVLDKNPEVFPPGSCPDAALYCGWYSLAKYVPAFKWVKGAVGFHVASAEATTLKQEGSNVWCKRMLEEGVAATLGPVGEPYLMSFPLPDEFFPLLMSGQTAAAGGLFSHPAPPLLDANPHRRPAVHAVQKKPGPAAGGGAGAGAGEEMKIGEGAKGRGPLPLRKTPQTPPPIP